MQGRLSDAWRPQDKAAKSFHASVVNWLLWMFIGALRAGFLSLDVFETPRSWHLMAAEATFGKPTVKILISRI